MKSLPNCSILILCGGKGSRLGPTMQHIPKVLAPVNGQPMLHYILESYKGYDFDNIIFATGKLSHLVEGFVESEKLTQKPQISNAGTEASMLQRIYAAKESFSDNVILSYGDTLVELDYSSLLHAHIKNRTLVTMVTGKIKNPFGVVKFDSNQKVTRFDEKPVFDYYIGCMIFSRELMGLITPDLLDLPDGQGLVRLFQILIQKGELSVFPFEGAQVTFNTPAELKDAEQNIKQFYTLRENQL